MYKKLFTAIFVLIHILSPLFAQNAVNWSKTDSIFHAYSNIYERQKVYVQTDKSVYTVGERIWLKAYMLRASDMKIWPDSSNLYIELIDLKQTVHYTILCKIKNGNAVGDMYLPDSLMGGWYQLRAYSEWSLNFEKNFLFTKTIRVFNSQKPNIDLEYYKRQKDANKDSEKIFISFYPEGGSIIEGIQNKVAFKLTDILGKGINKSIKLYDDDKNELCSAKAQHNGMGFFEFIPQKGKKYWVIIEGKKKKYKLENIQENGTSMNVVSTNKHFLEIHFERTKEKSTDEFLNQAYLFAHRSGKICYTKPIRFESKKTRVRIPVDSLEKGVLHFTLFNHLQQVIGERLWFNPVEELNIRPSFSETDSSLVLNNLTDSLDGAISCVPAHTKRIIPNDKHNILSYMYLESDLGTYIENAQSYFEENKQFIDLVMLTSKWKIFNWNEILNTTFTKPDYDAKSSITVSGKLMYSLLSVPISNRVVELTVLNSYNDVFQTKTDASGHFSFDGLNYSDTIQLLLESWNQRENKHGYFEIDSASTLSTHFTGVVAYVTGLKRHNFKNIYLTGSPYSKHPEPDRTGCVHNYADNVVYPSDYPSSGNQNVYEFLRGKVAGLNFTGNDISIRGRNSFLSSSSPLIVMDGVPTDISILHTTSINDIERIEILKNATIYGSRGGNGVIALFAKQGEYSTPGEFQLNILGYYTPYKFKQNQDIKDFTLYWETKLENSLILNKKSEAMILEIEGLYNQKPFYWVREID